MTIPKLDRVPFKDQRSRQFGVAATLRPMVPRRNRIWQLPKALPLDQGAEGACVGFGWAAELASAPIMYSVTDTYARRLYVAARAQDQMMGNDFPEGASVLAGAKVLKAVGIISEYRWAFGVDQIIDTLVQKGPVVLGVNWYESMYETDGNKRVVIDGNPVGGHCITAFGYQKDLYDEEYILWVNSWGRSYGLNGVGYLPVAGLERLMREDGEACIATDVRR